MIPAIDLVMIIYSLAITGIGIPLLFDLFRKYHHWSHFGFGVSNALFFCSVIAGFWTGDPASSYSSYLVAIACWDIFIVCAFWIMFFSLLLAQFDRVPFPAHAITFIVGMICVLFLVPGQTIIQPVSRIVSFSPAILILMLIVLVVFLFFGYAPLVKKMRHAKKLFREKQYIFLFAGYTLFVLYCVTMLFAALPNVNIIRRGIISSGVLCWNVALLIDPLTIVITESRVYKALFLTRDGLEIFSYDMEKRKPIDAGLISGLLSAIKTGMETVVPSGKALTRIAFEDSEINFINGEHTILVIVAKQALSSNFCLIANLLLRTFERTYAKQLGEDYIQAEAFGNVEAMIVGVIDKVLF